MCLLYCRDCTHNSTNADTKWYLWRLVRQIRPFGRTLNPPQGGAQHELETSPLACVGTSSCCLFVGDWISWGEWPQNFCGMGWMDWLDRMDRMDEKDDDNGYATLGTAPELRRSNVRGIPGSGTSSQLRAGSFHRNLEGLLGRHWQYRNIYIF